MDPLVLQAISLHKYNNNLIDKICLMEEGKMLPLTEDVNTIPELTPYKRKHVRNSLNYIEKNFT